MRWSRFLANAALVCALVATDGVLNAATPPENDGPPAAGRGPGPGNPPPPPPPPPSAPAPGPLPDRYDVVWDRAGASDAAVAAYMDPPEAASQETERQAADRLRWWDEDSVGRSADAPAPPVVSVATLPPTEARLRAYAACSPAVRDHCIQSGERRSRRPR